MPGGCSPRWTPPSVASTTCSASTPTPRNAEPDRELGTTDRHRENRLPPGQMAFHHGIARKVPPRAPSTMCGLPTPTLGAVLGAGSSWLVTRGQSCLSPPGRGPSDKAPGSGVPSVPVRWHSARPSILRNRLRSYWWRGRGPTTRRSVCLTAVQKPPPSLLSRRPLVRASRPQLAAASMPREASDQRQY